MRMMGCLLWVLFSALTLSVAESPADASVEIRIGLPDGEQPTVAVELGVESVRLDLPRGSRFPNDFVAASHGMLREGKIVFSEERIQIELQTALGVLDRVVFAPGELVLRFRSSYLIPVDVADPQNRYVLGPDDRIGIVVHSQSELSVELDITREGWITVPLLGQIKAAGLTPPQLAAKLTELLSKGYLTNPKVDVGVREYRSQWVVVSGEVKNPGRKSLRGGTKLKEVLGEAEGFNLEAGEEIAISRKPIGSADPKVLYISRTDFERGLLNPTLQHGDTIDVRRASYCYIQGEVRRAGRVRVERGMTLTRVIALAEGLTDWAERKHVIVLYPADSTDRRRTFNLNKIERGKAPDPVIRGGEDIIVKKRFL